MQGQKAGTLQDIFAQEHLLVEDLAAALEFCENALNVGQLCRRCNMQSWSWQGFQ